jgi:polyketide biosynthesis enoyl-CoA hydratase PksH
VNYRTIRVRWHEPVCFLQFHRPEANNTIDEQLIEECLQVLTLCEESITIIVLEGLPDVFCLGADFQGIHDKIENREQSDNNPEPLYNLWLKLATGPYISVSHIRGKVNAGGVGFVAASDIAIADYTAQFSLSELLFGLFPACVLPFLIRRIGFQKAHYLTLMTHPISVQQAHAWSLVDACDSRSESLLHKHLFRLKRLSKKGILQYKSYMTRLYDFIQQSKLMAIEANRELFSDYQNLERIYRYVENGQFPWED